MRGEKNRAVVPSVSRKLGSGSAHGTPSEDEQREEGREQLFNVFLLLLHQLTYVFVPSLWSSLKLSLASVMLFFFGGLVFTGGNPLSAAAVVDEIENSLFNSAIITSFCFQTVLRTRFLHESSW